MCRRLKSLISGDRGIAAFKPDDEELQRSEYYRRALDNAPDVIWILDLKTKRFRYVSAAVVKLRGYTPEEVIAQPLDEAFTPESAKKVSELIAFWNAKLPEKPAHPGSITIEVDQPCKDGSVIHTEVTVALVANGSRTVEVIGVSRNISARKKAAQELAASVERFRQFIESSHDIVWEVDAKGRYTYVSSGSKELLGCDPSEILGKTAFDFMSPEEMARVRSIFLSHAVEKKPFFRLINLRRRKDGGEVVLETSGVPYFDAEEKFLGFRGINHDITARTRSEEALRESEERFRNLVDASIEALVVHDRGVIVDVNPAFVRLFGYDSPEEITGRDCEFLLSPESADRVHKRISNQENGFLEITGIRKDGSTFIGELDSRPLNYRGRNARIASIRDITERKRAEHELARSEAELLAIYEHTPVMQCLLDKDLRIVRANRAMVEFSRRSPEELVGLAIGEVLGCTHFIDDRCRCGSGTPGGAKCPFRQSIIRVLETGNPVRRLEVRPQIIRVDGPADAMMLLSCSRMEVFQRTLLLLSLEDISVQKKLEEQFRQSQKMEAIGQLAGGIAHDFNNILAAIMMHLGLLQRNPNLDQEIRLGLNDLESEAKRASSLTRQLLMYSRRSVLDIQILDLNEIISNLLKMLNRLLGEEIKLLFEPGNSLPFVKADAGMLEQVLMNLVVNARDAMPKGGRITLATEAINIEAEKAEPHPPRRTGRFVCFSVSDTGLGMDTGTLKRIFEPFFTTKELGKGTGLGLATVEGIVSQHKGWVEVESQLGLGSSFRVYLPASEDAAIETEQNRVRIVANGKESLLVVEDEENVRCLFVQALRVFGYRVIEAKNGQEAFAVWNDCNGKIDLLLTDMVMPEGITGLELAQRLRKEKPDLKIIISSGYSSDMVETGKVAAPGISYLPKPFKITTLSQAVRDCLDRK